MKKFYNFALMLLTLLSSVLFFACGDKYKNLEMSFCSSDRAVIEKVELVIDENDKSKAQKTIGVKFSGIDEDDIGSVVIYSSSNESISFSDYVYDNELVWVNISANAPTKSSKIFVRHLNSNKLASVDLIVEQKSNDVKIENSNYIVSVPQTGENSHIIKTEETLKLLPTGSTDKVYYEIDTNSYENVELITEVYKDTEYLVGFKTNENSNGYAIIYPVTAMEGYDIQEFTTKTIKVEFKKVLNPDAINLKLDAKYPTENTILNPIKLIFNDKQTNSVTIEFEYTEGFDDETIISMYEVDFSSSNHVSVSISDLGDGKILVQCKTETKNPETVYINWRPYGFVGDINAITKEFYVKGEAKADFITVEKADVEVLDLNNVIDIYDYYANNSAGTKFEFIPKTHIKVPVYKNLSEMKIVVSPKILNAKDASGDETMYNPVYVDGSFATLITALDTSWRTNKQILDITKNNNALKFYFDNTSGLLISETFKETDKIYIRYKDYNSVGIQTNESLSITVKTITSSTADEYIKDTSSTDVTLNFSGVRGVKSVIIGAAHFTSDNSIESYGNLNLSDNIADLYLNVLDYTFNTGTDDIYKYILQFNEIRDFNENLIEENVKFDIRITSSILQNSLKVNKGITSLSSEQPSTQINYEYTNQFVTGAISLVFNTQTTVGEYTITISQPDTGFKAEVLCLVYEDIDEYDISGSLETDLEAFSNVSGYKEATYVDVDNYDEFKSKLYWYNDLKETYMSVDSFVYDASITYYEKDFIFKDYEADYIIQSGKQLNFDIELLTDSQLNSHIINGYSISYSLDDAEVTDYFNVRDNNAGNYTFNTLKGTNIEYVNKYITINLTIEIKKYENIITFRENTTLTNPTPIKIFIYEPVSERNISIIPSAKKYFADYLGAYYKNESQIELAVALDDTLLWNYIQTTSADSVFGDNNKKVVWYVENDSGEVEIDGEGIISVISQNDTSITVEFNAGKTNITGSKYRSFKAYLKQFNKTFSFVVNVEISKAIITEKVEVKQIKINGENENLMVNQLNNSYSVNLKLNDELELDINSFSSLGKVTFVDYHMLVADSSGNLVDNSTINVDNLNKFSIKVNEIKTGLKLIIFAKDALKYYLDGYTAGFNYPENLLVDFTSANGVTHQNAYVIINLELSDGKTKETAYLINSANDFWKMASDHAGMVYDAGDVGAPYYRITRNIDLSNATIDKKAVENFKGTITTTYTDYSVEPAKEVNPYYTIYGLNLGEIGGLNNLFVNLEGTIEYVKFNFNYIYNIEELIADTYLGVIDVNLGTLLDVSCEMSGTSKIDSNRNTAYFGGLVGKNIGYIKYENIENKCIGVSGSFTIKGNAKVYFGGLVGENAGEIIGYEFEDTYITEIEFVSPSLSEEGLMGALNLTSELNYDESSVGGVVGLNSVGGKIKNAEVGGSIISTVTNNIGGLIGTNSQEETTVKINNAFGNVSLFEYNYMLIKNQANVVNIKSYVVITGKNNIGGIVGNDTNGVYANIKYQILAGVSTSLNGESFVGGIAGASMYGKFVFCSVMSYKWDYSGISDSDVGWEDETATPDIVALDYTGGFIGNATSASASTMPTGYEQSVNNRVIISNSSVNAYLKSENRIGGVYTTSSSGSAGIIMDAYFFSKLKGNISYLQNMALFNADVTSAIDRVYAIACDDYNSYTIQGLAGGSQVEVNISNISAQHYNRWVDNAELNGGYIHLIDDNNNPIFEVAPTEIKVEVQQNKYDNGTGDYTGAINPYYVDANTLWIPYYRFISSESNILTVEMLAELNQKYNTVTNIKEFLKFTITPTGGARLKVQSSDNNVVLVSSNGDLYIKSVGVCKLTFSSRLNSGVQYSLNIIVTNPIGTEFELIDSERKQAVSNYISISKGSGKMFNVKTTGQVAEGYYYETNSNLDLSLTVSYNKNAELDLFKYKNYVYSETTWASLNKDSLYVCNSGVYSPVDRADVTEDNAKAGMYYFVKYNGIISVSNMESAQTIGATIIDKYDILHTTPFSISVLKKVETTFNFVLTPYLTLIDADGNTYKKTNLFGNTEFNLSTTSGPSNISLGYNSAILYPNDITIITAYIKTDKELDLTEINNIINNSLIEITKESGAVVENNSLISLNFYENYGYNEETGIHTIQLEVCISEDVCKFERTEEKRYVNMTIVVTENIYTQVDFLILPQRINSIEIKNYYKGYEEFTNYNAATWEEDRKNLYFLENGIYKTAKNEVYETHPVYYSLVNILEPILQPSNDGLMIIDIAPVNGYFDYLEIIDASGSEEIVFTQVDQYGYTMPTQDSSATSGKGIKLIKNYANYNNRIYVRTSIDESYSSKIHTVIVYAFLNGGRCLNPEGSQLDVNVEMLPQITAEYRLPSGKVGITASTLKGYNSSIELDLAVGTSASFYVTLKESDGIINYSLTGDGLPAYIFEHDVGNFYTLKYTKTPTDAPSYLGKSLTLTLTTQNTLSNGQEVTATVTFEIKLVKFVIHDVSVSNSVDSNNITQIYGNINQEMDLEFYFKPTDVSYLNNQGNCWDTTYVYDESIANGVDPVNSINNILRKLNTDPSKYIQLNYYLKSDILTEYKRIKDKVNKTSSERKFIESLTNNKNLLSGDASQSIENGLVTSDSTFVKLNGKRLKVTNEEYNLYYNVYLNIQFNLLEDNNGFVMDTTFDIKSNPVTNPTINKSYMLNFISATSPYEPKLIKNEEDFLSMTTGYYILGVDLVLENYVPLVIVEPTESNPAQLIEFDGNGRTITIKSFNTTGFTDEDLNVGLFRSVPSGTTIKNINVKYQTTRISGNYTLGKVNIKSDGFDVESYFDLCKNETINYNSVTFGGIAGVNNGVITNCNVFGEIALRASTIEQKKSESAQAGKYQINLFVGGLVGTNNSTGYITNSTNALRIFAQANIGGVVYENKGKIVSTAVDSFVDTSDITTTTYNPLIYTYNSTMENTIIAAVGGFAVINSGEISMSYVRLLSTELANNAKKGNIFIKDISAGFIYKNTGYISDAYVYIEIIENNNNNNFYGFVCEDGGEIHYAYTYINSGKRGNNILMFSKAGAKGLSNCIEFVGLTGYTQTSSGLTAVEPSNNTNKAIYENCNFAFGDNKTAVWKITSGQMPVLVSTQEKVLYTENRDKHSSTSGDTVYTYYYGLKNIVSVEEYKENDKGEFVKVVTETTDHSSYGTKNNPIIIVDRLESNKISNWENYFIEANSRKYFRIVSDINLKTINKNPSTSTLTFSGNIQGNNMVIKDYMLYSTNALESIGLFKEIISTNDIAVENSIRNLTLTATSVWASKTKSVGLLAGTIENYNLYNIHVDAAGVVMVGFNAVGGVAGLVRGNFDIQRLSSNIGVNSTDEVKGLNYSVYMSKNNNVNVSYNINKVHYAGSVIAILDGYDNRSVNLSVRSLSSDKYFNVKDIKVADNVVALSDTVGAAFGFVGERVYVKNIDVNLIDTAILSGVQYSAGAVGENRGIIDGVKVVIENPKAFDQSLYVSSGVVGLNFGGLIQNANSSFICKKLNNSNLILGGIVGRNINGTITDSISDAKISGNYTGGIIGANYSYNTLKSAVSSAGALSEECKVNNKLIDSKITYKHSNGDTINNLENTGITVDSLSYMLQNVNEFYSISNREEEFKDAIIYKKVLGLSVGITDSSSYIVNNYGLLGLGSEQKLMFNSNSYNANGNPTVGVVSVKIGQTTGANPKDIMQEWPCANVLERGKTNLNIKNKDGGYLTGSYMTYITGAVVTTFDSWSRDSYAADMLVITDLEAQSPMWSLGEENYYISIEEIKLNVDVDHNTRELEYVYIIRNLNTHVDVDMEFNCTTLLEDFDLANALEIKNHNTVISLDGDNIATLTYEANSYQITLKGTENVQEGEPEELTYIYTFKVNVA